MLGFDTATAATAVALQVPGAPARELRDDPEPGAHPGHATRLLELAGELLGAGGVRWGQLDRIAAGVGPGTFTGLRVGIATARGLAQALDAQLVGVSSLAALADVALAGRAPDTGAAVPAAAAPGAPGVSRVLAVIDARRGEVFAAAYERGADGRPAALATARAVAPDAVAEVLGADPPGRPKVAAEPDALRGLLAVGDGAVRYRAELQAAGAVVPPDGAPEHLIRAAAICALGAGAAAGERHQVAPEYLRRPDAELAFEAAGLGEPHPGR